MNNANDSNKPPRPRPRSAAMLLSSTLCFALCVGLGTLVGPKTTLEATAQTTGPALRTLADARGLAVGAAVRDGDSVSAAGCAAEPAYCDVLAGQYNMVVAENAMKFDTVHPQQGAYDFSQADSICTFAQAHGQKVRGHALVWGQQVPAWVTNGNFTPAQLRDILRDHIYAVVGHFRDAFPGVVTEWDVVNEAQSLGVWGNIGTAQQVATLAFTWAHEADPTVKLYYNDFGNEVLDSYKSNWVYNLAVGLKQGGVPIHGVGIQAHLTLYTASLSEMQANLARYAAQNIEVKFTELDVRLRDDSPSNLNAQAEVYHRVMTACATSESCTGVLTWGFTDKYSWIPGYFRNYGFALPFDATFGPKPAYPALQAALAPPPPPDPNPPTVSITSPAGGSTVARGSGVTIAATASDDVGVTKVEFYVNGALKGTDAASPYSYNWSVPSQRNKSYTLTARAYDAAGNATASAPVTVTAP